jgi:hypothetical protein
MLQSGAGSWWPMVARPCQFLDCGWLPLDAHQLIWIWTKSNGICGHETISVAFRPLNILHMGLMSDAAEWYWLLVAHGCQTMPIFGLRLAESLVSLIS